jgi:hypothetical protein
MRITNGKIFNSDIKHSVLYLKKYEANLAGGSVHPRIPDSSTTPLWEYQIPHEAVPIRNTHPLTFLPQVSKRSVRFHIFLRSNYESLVETFEEH